MTEYLKFEVTDAKIEKLIDDTTSLCLFRVISDGQNSHGLPLTLDVIKEAAESSLRGKPILASYSNWEDDLEGHKPAEQSNPIGYFVESQEFVYKPVEDGRTALYAKGILWKHYAPKQFNSIFSAKNHSKSVSMEIAITSLVDPEDKSKGIGSFRFLGLAVLGDSIEPASENASATLLTFSAMKEKYETMLFASKSRFTIDNSVESAFMDETKCTFGRALYSKIIDQPNAEYFAKEMYLEIEPNWFENPSKSISPHHKWRGNVLCLSRAGLEASVNYLKSIGKTSGEEFEHLHRHFSELGLEDYFSENFTEKEENKLEDKVMMEETPKEPETKEENPKAEPEKTEPEKEEPKKEFEQEPEEVDYAVKFADLEKKFAEQEKELFELRKFKADAEERDKNYAVEQLMSGVSDSLPKEKMEEFRDEAKELKLSEFAAFSNKVKACTLDFVNKIPSKDSLVVMATSMPEKVAKKSVWDF